MVVGAIGSFQATRDELIPLQERRHEATGRVVGEQTWSLRGDSLSLSKPITSLGSSRADPSVNPRSTRPFCSVQLYYSKQHRSECYTSHDTSRRCLPKYTARGAVCHRDQARHPKLGCAEDSEPAARSRQIIDALSARATKIIIEAEFTKRAGTAQPASLRPGYSPQGTGPLTPLRGEEMRRARLAAGGCTVGGGR
jgi:hypothetical protein